MPAAMPVISGPAGIIWESSAEVTITCATDGATIYYTTDGS
ncbi:MAG: chitobiase/beta-hexosaminidase C-terminal domain-containing protein, partial [Firmicutes bacterium]|nr:chitobiase/beta-hexosaminidase C-terminal domain-containing protein [Bacillota bacterium]